MVVSGTADSGLVHVVDCIEPSGTIVLAKGCGAVVTAVDGIAIGVPFADCHPVLFEDEKAKVRSVAHCSRASVVAGILEHTVEKMISLGAHGSRIKCTIGPGLCPRCHEIESLMFWDLQRACDAFCTTINSSLTHVFVDMPETIRNILTSERMGHPIGRQNIIGGDICTSLERCNHRDILQRKYHSCRGDDWKSDNKRNNNLAVLL